MTHMNGSTYGVKSYYFLGEMFFQIIFFQTQTTISSKDIFREISFDYTDFSFFLNFHSSLLAADQLFA
jgi:hypothetical protein